MKTHYIVHLGDPHLPDTLGNKARNLQRLREKQFRIPDTYVCTWEVYQSYLQNGPSVLTRLRSELEPVLQPDRLYAVRSSASLEDSEAHSFAGQFKTFLDVCGVDNILQAITEIYETSSSDQVRTYLEKTKEADLDFSMAVMIQDMVPPAVSGVAFSKNPVTGMDEIVVEAVQGRGTALVQDGLTPERWVYKFGKWLQHSEASAVPLELVQEIVNQTRAIARSFRSEVDLEWVYDGQKLYWLQVRDITGLEKINIYSNRMAREVTPGQIKPLVWSVTLPIPGHSWVQLITEVIGKNDLQVDHLAKAFHYRAYHNVGVFGEIFATLGLPRESLEVVMGVAPHGTEKMKFRPGPRTLRHIPRLLRFLLHKWTFGTWAAREYPALEREARSFSLSPSPDLQAALLIAEIDRIVDLSRRTSYRTVCSILLLQIYGALLRARLEKLGVDFQQFDLIENMRELALYDPGGMLRELHNQILQAEPEVRSAAEQGDYAAFEQLVPAGFLRQALAEFLDRFGHLSDSDSNFSAAPWRETPGLVLQLAANYRPQEDPPVARIRFRDLPRPGPAGWSLGLIYARARQFRLLREKYSSLFTYTYSLLRVYYLALGERLARLEVLQQPEDIYYLYDWEVRLFFAGKNDGSKFMTLVTQRKDEMEQSRDAVLPDVIYGDSLPLVSLTSQEKLVGTPTSRGYCTGTVKVVCGLGDAAKVQPGEVLVIPYSDVSWTPLFARAGGIISEAGGILSHSSIIAREYNIPSVVSVPNATRLLHDGDLVTIDGFKGEIMLHTTANGG